MYAPNTNVKGNNHVSSHAATNALTNSNAAAARALGGNLPWKDWMSVGATTGQTRSRQVNHTQSSHNHATTNHNIPIAEDSNITPPPSPPNDNREPPSLISSLDDYIEELNQSPSGAGARQHIKNNVSTPRESETVTTKADQNTRDPFSILTFSTSHVQSVPNPQTPAITPVRDPLAAIHNSNPTQRNNIAIRDGGMGDPIVIEDQFLPNLPPTPQASETATTPETGSPRFNQNGSVQRVNAAATIQQANITNEPYAGTSIYSGSSTASSRMASQPVDSTALVESQTKRQRIQGEFAPIHPTTINIADGVITRDASGQSFLRHRNGYTYSLPSDFAAIGPLPASQPPRRVSMPVSANQTQQLPQGGIHISNVTPIVGSNDARPQLNRSVTTVPSHSPSTVQQSSVPTPAATIPQPGASGIHHNQFNQRIHIEPRHLMVKTVPSQPIFGQDGQVVQSPVTYHPGQQSPAIRQLPQHNSVPASPATMDSHSFNIGTPQPTQLGQPMHQNVMTASRHPYDRPETAQLFNQLHTALQDPHRLGIDPRSVDLGPIDYRLRTLTQASANSDSLCLFLHQLLCYYHLGLRDRMPAIIRNHPDLTYTMSLLSNWFVVFVNPAHAYLSNHLMGFPIALQQFAMDYPIDFNSLSQKALNMVQHMPRWQDVIQMVADRKHPLLAHEFVQLLGIDSYKLQEIATALLLRTLSKELDTRVRTTYEERGLAIFKESISHQTSELVLRKQYVDAYYALSPTRSGHRDQAALVTNGSAETQTQLHSPSTLTNVPMARQSHQRLPSNSNTTQPSNLNRSPSIPESGRSISLPQSGNAPSQIENSSIQLHHPIHAQNSAIRSFAHVGQTVGVTQSSVAARTPKSTNTPRTEGTQSSAITSEPQPQTRSSQVQSRTNHLREVPEAIISSTCAVLPRLIREMDAEQEDDAPLSNTWRQLALQLQASVIIPTVSTPQKLIPPVKTHPSRLHPKRNIVSPALLIPTAYAPLPESRLAETHEKTLHQLDLMSPILSAQEVEMAGGSSVSICQFVSSFAMPPSTLTIEENLTHNLKFWVFKSDQERISTTLSSADGKGTGGINVINVRKDTLQYRIRCVQVAKSSANTQFELSKWLGFDMTCPTWMELVLNQKHLEARRKPQYGHFKKDLPFIISDHIKTGSNSLQVSLNILGDTLGSVSIKRGKPTDYWVAVEVIELLTPSAIETMAKSKARSKDAVLTELKKQFATSVIDDSDIITLSTDKIISVRDPFTSTLISELPVRSTNCRHNECFSLEYFIQSRPIQTKPYDHFGTKHVPKGSATQVDVWSCPICSEDARPTTLFVDEWMLGIRNELVNRGLLDTAAIKVNEHGRWEIKEEMPMSEDPPAMRTMISKVERNKSSTPIVISLLDDD